METYLFKVASEVHLFISGRGRAEKSAEWGLVIRRRFVVAMRERVNDIFLDNRKDMSPIDDALSNYGRITRMKKG